MPAGSPSRPDQTWIVLARMAWRCDCLWFFVSACVVTRDGQEFYGVNVEDKSTRAGTCAERNAIFAAVTAGYKKGDFKSLTNQQIEEVKTICKNRDFINFFDLEDSKGKELEQWINF